jgi:hypothetical protein
MKKEANEFIKAVQVVALHIERYSRQIDRLLSVTTSSDEDYDNGKVSKTQFYRQRNKKIKAYNDAIDTLIQKERLLQFHSSGFKISISEEKTEINYHTQPKWDLSALSDEEQVEILELMLKAKKNQSIPLSITPYTGKQDESIEAAEVVEERPNIELIKQIEAPVIAEFSLRPVDPVTKLHQIINKVAAQRFGEVGTLSEEEKNLYRLDSSK